MKLRHKLLLLSAVISPTSLLMAEQLFQQQGQAPVLIELYTSEGCSSCPPAEHYLNSFVDSPELWRKYVPLAFHVDYWDYIGWEDRFAQPQFKQRQYNHRRLGNLKSVYTPGWITGGNEWRGFFRGHKVTPQKQAGGLLQARLDKQQLNVSYEPNQQHRTLIAHVALLGFDLSSQVTAGENSGRLLKHQFVVLDKQQKPQDNFQWSFTLPQVDTSQRHALAIWISERNQKPLQVTADWLK